MIIWAGWNASGGNATEHEARATTETGKPVEPEGTLLIYTTHRLRPLGTRETAFGVFLCNTASVWSVSSPIHGLCLLIGAKEPFGHPKMSKLLKVFTDMIEGNSRNHHKKVNEPEKIKRSEFKKLMQQELSPVKRTSSNKYKHMKNLPDSDVELMNDKEVVPCVY